MTHYRTGSDFERRVRAALRNEGYWVTKSGGSKTVVDLIAVKTGELLFIQAKRTNGTIPPADRVALLDLARMVAADAIVAHRSRPGGPLAYRRLTGPGPKDWKPWIPDFANGETA